MFFWKILAASPYSSSMPVFSAKTFFVAVSAALETVRPAIACM
jgi:hypothetical protein